MSEKKKSLGRGLVALLGEEAVREAGSSFVTLRLSEIEPNMGQPRKHFDEVELAELSDSIRIHGVLTPLLVRRLPSGTYQIIAGERRWRAARMAGVTQLPAVILEADDRKTMEVALIENLQRSDLNILEIASGYRSLMDEFGLTQEDVAGQVGRSRSAVANALRLLQLTPLVREMLGRGELTEGHARVLLSLPNAKLQEDTAKLIIAKSMTVRQTEVHVKKLIDARKTKPLRKEPVNHAEEYEKKLSSIYSRKVKIVAGKKRGKIEIEFYSPDDLEQLMSILDRRENENA